VVSDGKAEHSRRPLVTDGAHVGPALSEAH
jgi:hypothetical protein